MPASTRTYVWFAVFLAIVGAAFVIPRLESGNQTGFAASTAAAVTFLGLFAAAGVLGVVLLVMTLRERAILSRGAKIAGFLPLPLLAAGLIVVVLIAVKKQQEQQHSEPPPRTLTPTAVPTAP